MIKEGVFWREDKEEYYIGKLFSIFGLNFGYGTRIIIPPDRLYHCDNIKKKMISYIGRNLSTVKDLPTRNKLSSTIKYSNDIILLDKLNKIIYSDSFLSEQKLYVYYNFDSFEEIFIYGNFIKDKFIGMTIPYYNYPINIELNKIYIEEVKTKEEKKELQKRLSSARIKIGFPKEVYKNIKDKVEKIVAI